jgi:hypothetical protein
VRQVEENLPASRLGNRVEGVGSGRSPGHVKNNTCLYGNMSREKFVTFVRRGGGDALGGTGGTI